MLMLLLLFIGTAHNSQASVVLLQAMGMTPMLLDTQYR
jgi:hypothetical protein